MNRPSINSPLAILLALAALATLAAGAFAYWSSAPTTTTATTVLPDPQPITFSVGVPTAELSPGHTAGVSIVAHNPNAYFVHISAMSLDTDHPGIPPFIVDAAHSLCDVGALSFSTQTNGGGGWNLPAKVDEQDGLLSLDLSSSITMSAGAANACQGASFTVRLVAAN
jgi:hypothetical protein